MSDTEIADRAARLQQARMAKFPRREEAAEAVGINVHTVRAHERGQHGIPIKHLQRYAQAYGVEVDWLLWGSGPRPELEPAARVRPEGAAVILHQMPNGKARLQINKVVDYGLALKVLAMLEGGE